MSRLLLLAALLAVSLAVWAVPIGLNSMPTAESLGFLESRTDVYNNSGGLLYGEHNELLIGEQTGLILGLEGGIDQVSDKGTVYNLKWVQREGLVMPGFALGAQNLIKGEHSQYYLVATKSFLPVKASFGFLRNGDGTATMVGASAQWKPIILKVDHIQGAGLTRDTASLGYMINHFTISGAYYALNNAPNESTVIVSYTEPGL